MIHSASILVTDCVDPHRNLALEDAMMQSLPEHHAILFLWQNRHTVVIGAGQNAWRECDTALLEREGGTLARRSSGGGAVYHDLGNLNFTFLVSAEDYDVAKQTEVILRAVQKVGIRAEKNGRNDLTVDGNKFSGHAYYKTGEQCYHHGTIMLDVAMAPLEKYLNVSPLKLEAKGVKSVRSRVVNLREYRPDLSIDDMKAALLEAFGEVYGLPVQILREEDLPADRIDEGTRRFSAPEWVYGDSRPLAFSREARFDWGLLRVDYDLEQGVLTRVALWSDGLEADYLSQVPALLTGCPLEENDLRAALTRESAPEEVAEGILKLLTRNEETL